MDARYSMRKNQWLQEWQVAPESFDQVLPRLRPFLEPFGASCQGQALMPPAKTVVRGLLAAVERKNVAALADPCGPNRLGLQGFIGWAAGDAAPLREAWLGPVGTHWGQGDGVLGCDPAACPKAGRASVGVARPWGGRLGTVDHGQGALSLGSVARLGHPRVALRLSLPQAWPQEKARLAKAGVPQARRGDRTRHPWAWERREKNGASLPHRGMAGDEERGRPSGVRRRLAAVGERDVLTVPAHTWRRDMETEPPPSRGQGRPPQRPGQRVPQGAESLGAEAWRRGDVRDGAKGPRVVDVGKRRVVSSTHRRQPGDEERWVVRRYRDRDQAQVVQGDDALAHAAPGPSRPS
jgi:DDE superfamily endonuclease